MTVQLRELTSVPIKVVVGFPPIAKAIIEYGGTPELLLTAVLNGFTVIGSDTHVANEVEATYGSQRGNVRQIVVSHG